MRCVPWWRKTVTSSGETRSCCTTSRISRGATLSFPQGKFMLNIFISLSNTVVENKYLTFLFHCFKFVSPPKMSLHIRPLIHTYTPLRFKCLPNYSLFRTVLSPHGFMSWLEVRLNTENVLHLRPFFFVAVNHPSINRQQANKVFLLNMYFFCQKTSWTPSPTSATLSCACRPSQSQGTRGTGAGKGIEPQVISHKNKEKNIFHSRTVHLDVEVGVTQSLPRDNRPCSQRQDAKVDLMKYKQIRVLRIDQKLEYFTDASPDTWIGLIQSASKSALPTARRRTTGWQTNWSQSSPWEEKRRCGLKIEVGEQKSVLPGFGTSSMPIPGTKNARKMPKGKKRPKPPIF